MFKSLIFRVTRKTKGRLAEAKVIAFMIENGYEVYIPFSDCSKYDLIAYRDGQLTRISVKYTSYLVNNRWSISLKQVSRRQYGYVNVDLFVHSDYDLLAVYIGPEDKVHLLSTADFNNTTSITIPKLNL